MQSEGAQFQNFKRMHKDFDDLIAKEECQKAIDICLHNLSNEGVPYLIYLNAYCSMEDLVTSILNSKKKYRDVPKLYYLSQKICPFYFDGYLTEKDKLVDKFNKLKQHQDYREEFEKFNLEDNVMNFNMSEKNNEITTLLKELLELKKMNLKGRELPQMIKKVMEFQIDDNMYQEICLNWMKETVDNIRNDSNFICCKCLFRNDEKLLAVEGRSQEFKRYIWPIKATNIMTHIKKTIVGFLNVYGGIIYVGIFENKDKKNTVVGITLDRTKLPEVYKFFKDLVDEVYPKHESFKVNNNVYTKYQGTTLVINDYVSMEFLPVAEKQEYYNVRCDKETEKLYIIKIFVKIGYPKHYYHLINNEHSIDFYVRADRNVEKKPFPEAHSAIYEKLDKFEEILQTACKNKDKPKFPDRKAFHTNCQYSMEINKIEKEDEIANSDYSSDDDSEEE